MFNDSYKYPPIIITSVRGKEIWNSIPEHSYSSNNNPKRCRTAVIQYGSQILHPFKAYGVVVVGMIFKITFGILFDTIKLNYL